VALERGLLEADSTREVAIVGARLRGGG